MTVLSQLRKLRLQVSLEESWDGLISIEDLKFVQMQIHLRMQEKPESLVQRVSDFAVQSICSLRAIELTHSER